MTGSIIAFAVLGFFIDKWFDVGVIAIGISTIIGMVLGAILSYYVD